jgi:hypothetical protein
LGFFASRHQIDFGVSGGENTKLLRYRNVPRSIAVIVSSGTATLVELQTVLSMEDVHNLLEVIYVDAYNQKVLSNGNNN